MNSVSVGNRTPNPVTFRVRGEVASHYAMTGWNIRFFFCRYTKSQYSDITTLRIWIIPYSIKIKCPFNWKSIQIFPLLLNKNLFFFFSKLNSHITHFVNFKILILKIRLNMDRHSNCNLLVSCGEKDGLSQIANSRASSYLIFFFCYCWLKPIPLRCC